MIKKSEIAHNCLNTIITLSLVGSAILSYNVQSNRSSKLETEQIDGIESKLNINLSQEHKIAILSRKAGEKQLLDLTLTADTEESWTFVKYKNGDEAWFECGEQETDTTVSDFFCLGYLTVKHEREFESASIYHIHPIKGSPIMGEIPSESDIEHAIHINKYLQEVTNDIDKIVDHKIVVPTGIYTIKSKAQMTCLDEKEIINAEENLIVNIMEILANETVSTKMAFEASMMHQKPAFFFLHNYNVAHQLNNDFVCVKFVEDRQAAQKYIAQGLLILSPLAQTK